GPLNAGRPRVLSSRSGLGRLQRRRPCWQAGALTGAARVHARPATARARRSPALRQQGNPPPRVGRRHRVPEPWRNSYSSAASPFERTPLSVPAWLSLLRSIIVSDFPGIFPLRNEATHSKKQHQKASWLPGTTLYFHAFMVSAYTIVGKYGSQTNSA